MQGEHKKKSKMMMGLASEVTSQFPLDRDGAATIVL